MSDGSLPAGTRERLRGRSPRSSGAGVRGGPGGAGRSTPGHGRWRRSGGCWPCSGPHPPGRGGQLLADADSGRRWSRSATPRLRPVLNATGVVLHTNLGRAPLAPEALARGRGGGPRLLATSSTTSSAGERG